MFDEMTDGMNPAIGSSRNSARVNGCIQGFCTKDNTENLETQIGDWELINEYWNDIGNRQL